MNYEFINKVFVPWLGASISVSDSNTVINRIKTHNILNGIIFSIVEFVITALVIAPFAIYYIIHGKVLYATVAIGIIFNCLTIVAFGLQQLRRKEKDVGIQHMFNKNVREQINREYSHLGNDTWVLTTTILLPFVMFIWVIIELLFTGSHRDE